MHVGCPELSVEGLIELRRVLMQRAKPDAFRDERSSTSPPLVEEKFDEAKDKTNPQPARTGARKRSTHPLAGVVDFSIWREWNVSGGGQRITDMPGQM